MKSFVFLYPIPEFVNWEIQNHDWNYKEGPEAFRRLYKERLNKCIDLRYRQKGFSINYTVFNGQKVSDVIILQESDRVFEVGMDIKTHTKKVDGEYIYPDADFILDQLGDIRVLRVSGFHLDFHQKGCVGKLAKRAHERGVDTLVDEDLTQFFAFRMQDSDFTIDKYPSYNPRKSVDDEHFDEFMEARINKPWLWQDY